MVDSKGEQLNKDGTQLGPMEEFSDRKFFFFFFFFNTYSKYMKNHLLHFSLHYLSFFKVQEKLLIFLLGDRQTHTNTNLKHGQTYTVEQFLSCLLPLFQGDLQSSTLIASCASKWLCIMALKSGWKLPHDAGTLHWHHPFDIEYSIKE